MKYNILDAAGGNVINTILADEDFVKANLIIMKWGRHPLLRFLQQKKLQKKG